MPIKLLCSSYSLSPATELVEACEKTYDRSCQLVPTTFDEEGLLAQAHQLESGETWACWFSIYDLGDIEPFVTLLLGLVHSKKPEKLVVALPQSQGNSLVHHQLSALIGHLQQAACPTIVLECPLLFDEIFLNRDLLEKEHLLMLPTGGATLSWIHPKEVVRQFTYHLIYSQVHMTIRLAEHIFLGGQSIAKCLTELIAHPSGGESWASKRLDTIDREEDQRLDREELTYYFAQLGWETAEIEFWVDRVLGNKPFISKEAGLQPIRPLLPLGEMAQGEPFLFLHLPSVYSFQEWEENEEVEERALMRGKEYWEGMEDYPSEREDVFSQKELERWLGQEFSQLQATQLLPGLGLLKMLKGNEHRKDRSLQKIFLGTGLTLLRTVNEGKDRLTIAQDSSDPEEASSWEWIHYEGDLRSIALKEGIPVSIHAELNWKDWKKGLGLLVDRKELSLEQINLFRLRGDLVQEGGKHIRIKQVSGEGKTHYFAGGTGIVAAMAMIRSHGNRQRPPAFHLMWAIKNQESLIFTRELDYWTHRLKEFTWSSWITEDLGAIRAIDIQREFPFSTGEMAYICGPKSYVKEVNVGLRAAGWPQAQIRQELFRALPHPEIAQRIQAPDLPPPTIPQFSIRPLPAGQ